MHINSPCTHSPLLTCQGKLDIFFLCQWSSEGNWGSGKLKRIIKNGNLLPWQRAPTPCLLFSLLSATLGSSDHTGPCLFRDLLRKYILKVLSDLLSYPPSSCHLHLLISGLRYLCLIHWWGWISSCSFIHHPSSIIHPHPGWSLESNDLTLRLKVCLVKNTHRSLHLPAPLVHQSPL